MSNTEGLIVQVNVNSDELYITPPVCRDTTLHHSSRDSVDTCHLGTGPGPGPLVRRDDLDSRTLPLHRNF